MSWTGLNWTGQHPRLVVDLTGDGKADIVGFGDDGVWTAIGDGGGAFQPPRLVSDFGGVNSGWRGDLHPRFVVDLTGDGKADIVGFGDDGVWTAIGTGDGTFQPPQFVAAELGVNSGWRTDQHPRFVVDLTGDGKADIVGFGDDGVWTAIGDGGGAFQPPRLVSVFGGVNSGWRGDLHPRCVVDLTGDGKADIVGFGDDGVWTAIGTGDGTFQPAQFVAAELGVNSGWRTDLHPRFVVDLTGDGKADIVGFVTTVCGRRSVTVTARSSRRGMVSDFGGVNSGWRGDLHPRFVVDLTGDGKADIVGFGDDGVWTAIGTGDGTFQPAQFVAAELGVSSGWRTDLQPRFVVDLTGDGKADIVGFGDDGVWTAIGTGDGTLQRPRFVLADLGADSAKTGFPGSLSFAPRTYAM